MRLRTRTVRPNSDADCVPLDETERLVRSRIRRSIRSAARSLVLDVDDAFALALIGVESWSELVTRLGEKFEDGMDWCNPDSFHIDHRIPISSFDRNSLFQMHACFFHENLYPIDWRTNLEKGSRVCLEEKRAYLKRFTSHWARNPVFRNVDQIFDLE